MPDLDAAPNVSWPLSHERRAYLAQLAGLLKQFGAEHFTTAPIVRANERDFPEKWEPTITGVHRVLYRLCWHAHWEPEITVDDQRPHEVPHDKMLIASEMELASAANGVVTVAVGRIGNDDIAGLLGHRVGQAFLELAPGDPFREAGQPITETAGSVAATYLGLGVLVANSAMYRRYASKFVARVVVEEHYVAEAGGLTIGDATFLLAVQDLMRDDVSTAAFDTLLKPQREWLQRWRAVLEDHEDELRAMLELDDAPSIPLSRGAVPRKVEARDEPDLRKFNTGHVTFRVPYTSYGPVWLGLCLGLLGFLLPHPMLTGPALMIVLAAAGRLFVRKQYICADTSCGRLMRTLVQECPGCGGWIASTIKHANDRLDAFEQWEREQAHSHDSDDEHGENEENAS